MFQNKCDASTVKRIMNVLDLNRDQIFHIQTSNILVTSQFSIVFIEFLADLSIHHCILVPWVFSWRLIRLNGEVNFRNYVTQNKIWVQWAEHFKFVFAHFLTKLAEIRQECSMIIQTQNGVGLFYYLAPFESYDLFSRAIRSH